MGVCLSLLDVDGDASSVSSCPGMDCHAPSSFLSLFLVGVDRIGFLSSSTLFSLFSFLICSSSLALASWTGLIAGLLPGCAAPIVNLGAVVPVETFSLWLTLHALVFLGDMAEAGVFLGVVAGVWRIILLQAG